MSYFPISSLFPKQWQIYNYKTPTSDDNMSAGGWGGSGKLAITTETETEKRRCLPKHRFFSCYDFCGGSRSCRTTPHYLGERGTQTFSFLISKVQTRRRHPSSSPMTDCCNYSGILSDGGGGAPAECCHIFFWGGGRDQIVCWISLPALRIHFTTTPVAPMRQK